MLLELRNHMIASSRFISKLVLRRINWNNAVPLKNLSDENINNKLLERRKKKANAKKLVVEPEGSLVSTKNLMEV